MADILFEDIFEVKDIDSGGKKFLRGQYLSVTPSATPVVVFF